MHRNGSERDEDWLASVYRQDLVHRGAWRGDDAGLVWRWLWFEGMMVLEERERADRLIEGSFRWQVRGNSESCSKQVWLSSSNVTRLVVSSRLRSMR